MEIILSAYPAKASGRSGLFSIVFDLTGAPDLLPRKRLGVKNTAAAMEALDAYVEEARATGKLLGVSIRVGRGRKAAGFDKACAARPSYTIVNAPEES